MAVATGGPERIYLSPDPIIEGRNEVQASINNATRTGKSRDDLRREVDADVKTELASRHGESAKVRKQIDKAGEVDRDSGAEEARHVTKTVSKLIKAAQEGLIEPPANPLDRAVFEELVARIPVQLTRETAVYMQPLLHNLLTTPNYIQFSAPGSPPTAFETDLINMISAHEGIPTERLLKDVFGGVAGRGLLPPGVTIDEISEKFDQVKKRKNDELKSTTEKVRDRSDIQNSYILNELQKAVQEDPESAGNALEMFNSMGTAKDFHAYYRRRHEKTLGDILRKRGVSRIDDITSADERAQILERASKDTTREIHETLLYTTHLILRPIVEGDPRKSWEELLRESTGAYGVNPQSIFMNYKNRFINLAGQVDTFDSEYDDEDYYNFGTEEKFVYEESPGASIQSGRMVRKQVVTPELKKVNNFKEYITKMEVALDTEFNLLQVGVNYNYLLQRPEAAAEKGFFKQAAAYAQQNLPSHRIDQMYHLPYAEMIHAAKIQLSSYFKKRLAMNDHFKDPQLFYDAWQQSNKVQSEALYDLLNQFRKNGAPEWAIRRAFLHARMHLSVISQEWHGYAGYAHPNLTREGNPTYTDPAFKALETYRPWAVNEQWQVPDTAVQGLGYMPQPDLSWEEKKWIPDDVKKEGEDIYHDSFRMGKMATLGRNYFDPDTTPWIFELNRFKNGGIEIAGGWRFKYSAMPWLFDMIDHTNADNEVLKTDNPKVLTEGWKRLENIGVNVLKTYRDTWLFDKGPDIKLKDGKTAFDSHYEDFYKFLYRRYFKEGVGRDGCSISFEQLDDNGNIQEITINYSDIEDENYFWEKVVKPILHRKPIRGEVGTPWEKYEDPADAAKRNDKYRKDKLSEIVTQALTVMTYERVPMDFVFMENPTRSQNGVTLMMELREKFIGGTGLGEDEKTRRADLFEDAIDDILYVQGKAREVSIKQMEGFVREQEDAERSGASPDKQRNVYAKTLSGINQDKSDVELIEGQKGYIIDRNVVKAYLQQKYKDDLDPAKSTPEKIAKAVDAIGLALNVYDTVTEKIVKKPKENPLMQEGKLEVSDAQVERNLRYKVERSGEIYQNPTEKEKAAEKERYKKELLAQYKKHYAKNVTTRIMWSKDELLSGETGLAVNDTAYPFLSFTSVGPDMVARTLDQTAETQEIYSKYIAGDFLSHLKKIYRKEDMDDFFEKVGEIRSSIKNWVDGYDEWAFAMVHGAMMELRIDSRMESMLGEATAMALHLDRCALSSIVKEGPENPMRSGDRREFLERFLWYGQFPKRATGANRKFTKVPEMTREEAWQKHGMLMAKVGAMMDKVFGKKKAKYIRDKGKELTGEGLRIREMATLWDQLKLAQQGGEIMMLIIIAAIIAIYVKGMGEVAEDFK